MKIDISRDVTFDKYSAYIKSRKRLAKDRKETRAPKFMIQPRTKKFKKKIEN